MPNKYLSNSIYCAFLWISILPAYADEPTADNRINNHSVNTLSTEFGTDIDRTAAPSGNIDHINPSDNIISTDNIHNTDSYDDDTTPAATTLSDNDGTFSLYRLIPQVIESTPNIFPQQSDHAIVPNVQTTKNRTWADRQQYRFSQYLKKSANVVNRWFDRSDHSQNATAQIRLIVDSTWNKYDHFSIEPRVRGRVKLPALERRLSVVFGDDDLDNNIIDDANLSAKNTGITDPDKHFDKEQTRKDNASLALRWSAITKRLKLNSDVDVGIRSGDDVFVRLQLDKSWQMAPDFYGYAAQIYRYGLQSEHYLRTNLEMRYAPENKAQLINQSNITYTDHDTTDLTWGNSLFRRHQFFKDHYLNYGIYAGGYFNRHDPKLNNYGPFISWRQPFLREWLFLQTEVSYYNDKQLNRSHYLHTLLRIESKF